jgi:hypothetical protein
MLIASSLWLARNLFLGSVEQRTWRARGVYFAPVHPGLATFEITLIAAMPLSVFSVLSIAIDRFGRYERGTGAVIRLECGGNCERDLSPQRAQSHRAVVGVTLSCSVS